MHYMHYEVILYQP